jgi:hypothetical protein
VGALFGERPIGLGAVLVDGRVQGAWHVERVGGKIDREAMLQVRTVEPLGSAEHDEVADEGERLLGFLWPDVTAREVRISSPR